MTAPTTPRIGSMCTGCGALDMAVQAVFGGEVAWFAELDPDASAVLAHHWPGVPNLGDLTAVDWAAVEPVDVVCAGYPCQPFSVAGQRRGLEDDRHIWPYIAAALRLLRPQFVVLENVRGHLGRGFTSVLGDLAALGFDARWQVVRASDVGAPHQRARLFVLARPADTHRTGLEGAGLRGTAPERRVSAADAPGDGRHEGRPEPARQLRGPDAALGGAAASADANRDERAREPREQPRRTPAAGNRLAPTDAYRDPVRQQPVSEPGSGHASVAGLPGVEWGPYEPAIRRWEHATGRAAPAPTEPGRTGPRLSPAFVEWLMGLPAGHVTVVPGISRNAMLRILGNGVVFQQAAAALALLLEDMEVAA